MAIPGCRIMFRSASDTSVHNIENAVKTLKKGGLVIMPTDTVYGIAAHPSFPEAEKRIFSMKGRDNHKPIPLLVADIGTAESLGIRFGAEERVLADRFWPGPLTLVLDAGSRKEGVRVPDHALALDLIRGAGGALRVTSANVSGNEPASTAEEAMEYFGPAVTVVNGGRAPGGTVSTVAEVISDGRSVSIDVKREGAITAGQLESVLDA